MSNTAKEVVRSAYEVDLIHNLDELKNYLHSDIQLDWNSSFGFLKKDYNEIISMFKGMSTSFESLRCEISHLLAENDSVTIRCTYYVATIENPDKEEYFAHFITIWELKDNKLYRGYQIS